MVQIAIRELVEFVLRWGDIDSRFGGLDRALEGSRIHRKLQKAGGEAYQAEVMLSGAFTRGGTDYTVEGRADGVITQGDRVTIDEIKTTAAPVEQLTEDFNPLHWAQGMCYAYIYAVQRGLDEIHVRLTYYQIDTDEIVRHERAFQTRELEEFFYGLLDSYQKWADFRQEWGGVRDASIRALDFPFPSYRQGQRLLAVASYKTIRASGKLFAQAPTGIGKTISTLFPAVKAIGEGEAEKIFYLTAKGITRQAAGDAAQLMRERGLRLKSVTLTAKDKICFLDERSCNPDDCPYAKGHFDRVNGCIYDMLLNSDVYTREEIESYARKHTVCPFELSLDLTLWSDLIVCDYNYLFNPAVYLKRFFQERKGDYVFLIDEAHNLVDRGREMFSATIHKSGFLALKRTAGARDARLKKALNAVNTAMVEMRKECGEHPCRVVKERPDDFLKLLTRFSAACEEWLQVHKGDEAEVDVLTLYFETLSFLRIADFYSERYVTFYERSGSEVSCSLQCLDPSALLDGCMNRGKASILFSATLTPIDYFMSVLSGDENAKKLLLPSPYDENHLCLLAASRIDTRYKKREQSYSPIADMIYQTVRARTGNYLVYFPSYQYLSNVYELFCERYPDVSVIRQSGSMTEQEREEFLARFDAPGQETLVGYCVLGGVYAEGIDLKGDRLIGTVIVGVGLPQLSARLDVIRDYYDAADSPGYEYAYVYPGMNKVLQAAGRVIRSEQDRGVVLLIDDRFLSPRYRRLFPQHYQGLRPVRDVSELQEAIASFWSAAT